MSMDFYETVKKWTVNDYRTPGIKAEVILDMLISEFIEDIISYCFDGKAVLLAKEFPIRTNDDNYLNAKVDYLVCLDNEKLLLVELKTTADSFSQNQMDRMKCAAEQGAAELFKFYDEICSLKSGNSLDCKKYKYSRAEFDKKAHFDKISDVDYFYILLTDDTRLDKKLVLKELCSNADFVNFLPESRRDLWNKISGILLECLDNF